MQCYSQSTKPSCHAVLQLEGYWPALNPEVTVYCPRIRNFKYPHTTWQPHFNLKVMVLATIKLTTWSAVSCTWKDHKLPGIQAKFLTKGMCKKGKPVTRFFKSFISINCTEAYKSFCCCYLQLVKTLDVHLVFKPRHPNKHWQHISTPQPTHASECCYLLHRQHTVHSANSNSPQIY